MLAGHLAAAFVAKSVEPKAPLGALVAAAFGLDLIWPLLLFAGVERVSIEPGATAFTPLAFEHYPWSHSLVLACAWGALAFAAARALRQSTRSATVIGAVVVSHWVLDFVVHAPDLPLWPDGPLAGLGLWNSIPATVIVEGLLYAAAIALYVRTFRPRWGWYALVVFMGAIWIGGPFSPPPPGTAAVAWVTLALWILPFWAWRLTSGSDPEAPPNAFGV